MVSDGFITSEERSALNEIYDFNPLLFDFVLKRTMRHPETKQKLPLGVYGESRAGKLRKIETKDLMIRCILNLLGDS